jgi:EAL domain-containing protein (putative c-di-GMP-specific phosphodiesterase class I)
VDVKSLEVAGFEVLLRWRNDGAPVAPGVFVPVLEESGLIVQVGRWLLGAVCRQLRTWMDAGLPPVPVAVNVSAQQLECGTLLEDIEEALAQFRVSSELLQLEITESSVIRKPEEAIETLGRLRARGLTVAMDDFGTGYSSLGYLRRLPVDIVKIDRTFITDLPTNAEDAAIARAVIEMAHSLGLTVVAEGVETQAQLSWLEAQGCDQLQGFLFSPPLHVEDAAQLLVTQDRTTPGR